MTANKTTADVLGRVREALLSAQMALACGQFMYNKHANASWKDGYANDLMKVKECLALLDTVQTGEELPNLDCETCEGLGRIDLAPDEDGHTHPCDDCQPEAYKKWLDAQPKPEVVTVGEARDIFGDEHTDLVMRDFPNGLKIIREKK